MAEQSSKSKLAETISERAADLRLAWRSAAKFDDVAVMHINDHGEQMLLGLSAQLESGLEDRHRTLFSQPPWTGNKGDADAPLSLLVSLDKALIDMAGDDSELLDAARAVIERLSTTIDSLQRDKVRGLEEQAATDALTGAMSRAALMEQLEMECARSVRYGRPLSVVFMDVDGLKATNDEEGHRAGDDLLRQLVKSVQHHTRSADLFGRLGGDEFLLVLPETDAAGAEATAGKLSGFLAGEGLSASFGTSGTPETTPEPEALVEAADAAMRALRAKRA